MLWGVWGGITWRPDRLIPTGREDLVGAVLLGVICLVLWAIVGIVRR